MSYYEREILHGLDEVPTPNYPGTLVVMGDAQAVFTVNSPGDTIMAATQYGSGRLFATAHDNYIKWLLGTIDENENQKVISKFVKNLKKWLTREANVAAERIIKFSDLDASGKSFDDFKLITWNHSYDPDEEMQERLLEYVSNGGGLMCATAPWGYLQIYPQKTLEDMVMYRFLKRYMGMVYNTNHLSLPNEMPVSENRVRQWRLNVTYYDQEILHDLDEVPTPNHPGTLVVIGLAQAVFSVRGTANNPSDIIMAATQYGSGRVFVAAHYNYMKWLLGTIDENENQKVITKFVKNLKQWLTREANVAAERIINFSDLAEGEKSFDDFKLIIWNHSYDPDEEMQERLLEYVSNGGGLMCSTTPWGFLQIYPQKTLEDLTMYRFLKKYMGIVCNTNFLSLPNEMPVNVNESI
jgi:hypothetical protein